MTDSKVLVNKVYIHPEGLKYRVEEVLHDVTCYEVSHEINKYIVIYTQLDDGSYPAGTRWSRSEEDFLEVFKLIEE